MRRFRFALAPRWWPGHLLVLAACVVMVLLGRWQWHVAHVHHGDIRNYAYAFQWWAFTAFALLMWGRILRDQAAVPTRNGTATTGPSGVDEPVAYRRYVMPQPAPAPSDAERDRYNEYLRALARKAESS